VKLFGAERRQRFEGVAFGDPAGSWSSQNARSASGRIGPRAGVARLQAGVVLAGEPTRAGKIIQLAKRYSFVNFARALGRTQRASYGRAHAAVPLLAGVKAAAKRGSGTLAGSSKRIPVKRADATRAGLVNEKLWPGSIGVALIFSSRLRD
jgi:hypothetical protein